MTAALLLALALAADPAPVPAPPAPPAKDELAPKAPEPCPVEEPTVPTPPGYKDRFPAPPDLTVKLSWHWTTGDTVREALVLGLIALDWKQTRMFRMDGIEETNPIVGRNPSRARVNTMIAGAMLAHVGISFALPHGEWRTGWQLAIGGGEAAAVMNNWRGTGCNPFHARCG